MTAIERVAPAESSGARPISSHSVTWTPKPAIELSSQRAVRRHNLGMVLRQVVERGPRSRATIALDTGLNKTTVSSLVSELMDLGLLV